MKERLPRQKSLFTVPASVEDPPSLLCGRCSCGHVFFPPHRFGCEDCGAGQEAITISEEPATGILKAFAVVHGQSRPDGKGPLVVGRVLLDNGPSIMATLDVENQGELAAGQRVCGTLVPDGRDTKEKIPVDLLFTLKGGVP